MTALSRQRAGKSRVGGRVIGLDLESATSRPLQFRPAALRLQRRPEIEVCTREIGVEKRIAERLAEIRKLKETKREDS